MDAGTVLGTITWEEFLESCETFVELSKELSDNWELVGDKSSPGQAYLRRRVKIFVPCDYFEIQNAEETIDEFASGTQKEVDEDSNDIPKDPFEALTESERPLVTEHHILWSITYNVPVLYFNGWKSGMNPVGMEEAQRAVKNCNLGYRELSQTIHPILNTPFLYLHPCMSQELLQHTYKSKNKLVSWLSTVAPAALSLKMHPDYCRLTL